MKADDLDVLACLIPPSVDLRNPSSPSEKATLTRYLNNIEYRISSLVTRTIAYYGDESRGTVLAALRAIDKSLLRIAYRFVDDYKNLNFSFAALHIASLVAQKGVDDKACIDIARRFYNEVINSIAMSDEYDDSLSASNQLKSEVKNNKDLARATFDLMEAAANVSPESLIAQDLRELCVQSAQKLFARDIDEFELTLALFADADASSDFAQGQLIVVEAIYDALDFTFTKQIRKDLEDGDMDGALAFSCALLRLGTVIAGSLSTWRIASCHCAGLN